jgi:hypothetical protein
MIVLISRNACFQICVRVYMRSNVYASNADFINYDIISFSYLN